jgi:excisionase family DNA binding protein
VPGGTSQDSLPEPPPSAVLLTVAQVCEGLQISRPTFYGLIHSGRLKSLTIGRARRVPLAALEEFIEEATRAGSPGALAGDAS